MFRPDFTFFGRRAVDGDGLLEVRVPVQEVVTELVRERESPPMKVLAGIDSRVHLCPVFNDQGIDVIGEIVDFLVLNAVRAKDHDEVDWRDSDPTVFQHPPRHLPDKLRSGIQNVPSTWSAAGCNAVSCK